MFVMSTSYILFCQCFVHSCPNVAKNSKLMQVYVKKQESIVAKLLLIIFYFFKISYCFVVA